ncbi:multiprotein-bridging factor 1 family protein [Pseudomonadota bacterium]
MIQSSQCRAARALLQWSQQELAVRANLGVVTVRKFENQKSTPHPGTVELLSKAFEAAGVAFIDGGGQGPGVRLVAQEEGHR